MRIFAVVFLFGCLVHSGSTGHAAPGEWQKLRASTGAANEEFGVSVAVSGATALVGAWRDDTVNLATGSAFIFERDTTRRWIEVRTLVSEDPGGGDGFGRAVALQGEFGLVGAPGDDARGSDAGGAYILERDLGGTGMWRQRTKLLGSDIGAGANFGVAVDLEPVLAVVGAPGTTGGGAAYLFERTRNGPDAWGELRKFIGPGVVGSARFGAAAAIEGDVVAVGAPGDSDAASDAGAVFVFRRDMGDVDGWGLVIKLTPGDAAGGDEFGAAVVLRGNILIVGATQESGGGAGAVYVFNRDRDGADAWGLVRKITLAESSADALFGAALSMDEDLLLVGAPGESRNGEAGGAAYLFHRDLGGPDQYGQAARLFGSDASAQSVLGGAVALWGRTALVGAAGDDEAGQRAGAVYVFDPTVGAPTPRLQLSPTEVTVSWVPNPPGYLLDQVATLGGSPWQEVPGSAVPPVTVARGESGFFRLRSIARAEVDFVPVGHPANAPDTTGFGDVSYPFQIGSLEVSNEEYTRFLNAVGTTSDPAGLYNVSMTSEPRGGITRSTIESRFLYSAKPDMGDKPVNFVSYYDALRFANWLHNGQPTGGQDASTTEDGAYTFSGPTTVSVRAATAKAWLPSENEWYKAAYYDPTLGGTGGYWVYPTRNNTTPMLASANAVGEITNPGVNVANFDAGAQWNGQIGNVTTVGSAGSRSFYRAADLGGNVAEWTEGLSTGARVRRGGSWADFEANLESTNRSAAAPATEDAMTGFRVARP